MFSSLKLSALKSKNGASTSSLNHSSLTRQNRKSTGKWLLDKVCSSQKNDDNRGRLMVSDTSKFYDSNSHYADYCVYNKEKYNNQCVKHKLIDVFIERDGGGSLGIVLRGGAHSDPNMCRPLIVTHVRVDGPADREGTIKVGDHLLAVDGMSLNGLTLAEADAVLRQSDRACRLTIRYQMSSAERIGDAINPMLVEVESPRPHQLGLSLTNTLHNSAVVVDHVKPGSIAERSGAIFAGDQIVAVNDIRVAGTRMAASDVYKLLRACGGARAMLRLEIIPVFNSEMIHADYCSSYDLRPYNMCSMYEDPSVWEPTDSHNVVRTDHTILTLVADENCRFGVEVRSNNSVLVVCSIEPGGPADRTGCLQVGDRILSVNGCKSASFVALSQQPLHEFLGPEVKNACVKIEFDIIDFVVPTSGEFTIKLIKSDNRNLGITITDDGNGHVSISEIVPGSIAHRSGTLKTGDTLLAVDNKSLHNCSRQEATEILQEAGDVVTLHVQTSSVDLDDYEDDDDLVQYTVELYKKGEPLGITITGSEDSRLPISIQELSPGGLVARTGAIHVGDRLLAINGTDLSQAPLSTAISQLQNTDDRVVITVSRPQRPLYTSIGLLSTDSAIESDTTQSAPNLHEPTPERIVLRHRSRSAQRKVPEFDSDYFGGTLRPYYIREHTDYDVDSIFRIAENQDRDGLLDYDLFQVTLFKDGIYEDFGFSISDGLYERGVFVNNIRKGGPADMSGMLKRYDRIIQVNNTRTDDSDCCLTVPLIATAGDKITLTVERRNNMSKVQFPTD
ncbi:glutamate receptor-interacting protein 2-like isoform X2 [Daktulosphaira vitifoliae]|uniref:glutamate receptor-interacting protein 2-like isoform X2 n=1 Tax=Daktulosphaira vitifoliae TaxID=58002 RepID=UPI0021AB07DC|nr:glutamate receptor-interacting protein 2-like isoform X2 [Daktulosphaira vitifoliae]